jgi:POT family proton-dependent oligopeptide transporter
MVLGLAIYVFGTRYLPPDSTVPKRQEVRRDSASPAAKDLRNTMLVLGAIGLTVMLFRGAYEQVGNTIALWADTTVDRVVAADLSIPMTWFQALNPLLVILLTPLFVAHWTRQAVKGREPAPARKMSFGALGVAAAYLLLSAVSGASVAGQVSWLWLALFFLILTAGELFILPVGLGLFARLAPEGHGATTIAEWFFAAFGGNLLAGALGTLWSEIGHTTYFALMALVAATAGLALWLLDRPAGRLQRAHAANPDKAVAGQ